MISKTGSLTRHEGIVRAINYILVLPSDTLLENQKLTDFDNWDSLTVMEMVALAARYDVTLTTEQVLACGSVADFIALIENSETAK